jgi:c-di-GMP-binding flagellar brake protein YcgR
MTLLQAVLKKLSSNTPKAIEQPPIKITEQPAKEIERWEPLQQLRQQRQLLEIIPKDSQRSFQSMIIAIDSARGFLWLDDLFPAQRTLEIGDTITIKHHRDGEVLTMTTPIIAWGRDFGASGIAVALPEAVSYQPRRLYPRWELNEQKSLTGKIRTMGQEPVYGSIEDLSAGGMRILVAGNMLSQIHHGAVLPLCHISLSRECQIRCRARVRAFRICRTPYRGTQISLEFVDLPSTQQRQLQQFIYHLSSQHQADQVAA